jgi:hypothetical protein
MWELHAAPSIWPMNGVLCFGTSSLNGRVCWGPSKLSMVLRGTPSRCTIYDLFQSEERPKVLARVSAGLAIAEADAIVKRLKLWNPWEPASYRTPM